MNNLLIILLLLLFVMVLLNLFNVKEGFQSDLSGEFSTTYNKFQDFYNTFQDNWTKTLATGVVSDQPQQELSSPSQVPSSKNKPPQPSMSELNKYAVLLSSQTRTPFPQLTKPLPTDPELVSLDSLIRLIPSDPIPYKNALDYMNLKLMKAMSDMEKSLRGEKVENFEDICQNINNCIAQNQIRQQTDIINRMNRFLMNRQLMAAAQKNKELVKKADEIKRQAESGELVNKVNLPPDPNEVKFKKDPSDDKLKNMKKNNPEEYDKLANSSNRDIKMFFGIKQTTDGINSNL